MNKLLVLLALVLSLAGASSCATNSPKGGKPWVTPKPWIRYYHHQQRRNERQRRRVVNTNITWSSL